MLRQRLITAAVLIPLAIWGIIGLPTAAIAVILAGLVVIGAWEWSGLLHVRATVSRIVYVAVVLIGLAVAWYLVYSKAGIVWAASIAGLWWAYVLARLVRSSAHTLDAERERRHRDAIGALAGALVLIPAWMALVALHGAAGFGPRYLLVLLFVVWAADIGAYFTGRAWGSRRLAPHISPGKTWEGVYGGMACVAVLGVPGGLWLGMEPAQLPVFALLCIASAGFSIAGDLLVSFFKRLRGVKDSGQLLPGHGGLLDRFDSTTAAAPVFLLGLLMMGMGN